jgi:hypothetical protein
LSTIYAYCILDYGALKCILLLLSRSLFSWKQLWSPDVLIFEKNDNNQNIFAYWHVNTQCCPRYVTTIDESYKLLLFKASFAVFSSFRQNFRKSRHRATLDLRGPLSVAAERGGWTWEICGAPVYVQTIFLNNF